MNWRFWTWIIFDPIRDIIQFYSGTSKGNVHKQYVVGCRCEKCRQESDRIAEEKVVPGDDWSPEAVTQAKAPKGRFPWLEDKVPPCPTFYCENCRSNEPHGMICDPIYGERKRCVRCFNVTPVLSAAQELFSDANLRPDIGFDEAKIKLEIATRVYNEWAVKYALWRESDACIPILQGLPTCVNPTALDVLRQTVTRKSFSDEPQYTD